jgi:hypothetical protein
MTHKDGKGKLNNSNWNLSTNWIQDSHGNIIKETEDNENKYTQRQWDRIVGWGKVPAEYSYNITVSSVE